MGTRSTKKIPEFVYFTGGYGDSGWVQGPYVNPQKGYENRKFKLIEIIETKIEKK